MPTVYAVDDVLLAVSATGKGSTAPSMSIPGGATTSTATASAQKNGSNSASITVTFSDGVSSFTAVLNAP